MVFIFKLKETRETQEIATLVFSVVCIFILFFQSLLDIVVSDMPVPHSAMFTAQRLHQELGSQNKESHKTNKLQGKTNTIKYTHVTFKMPHSGGSSHGKPLFLRN